MNIYVGNLPFSITEDKLKETFAEFGEVTTVKIITDKFTGRSKGFGFVEMSSDDDAENAINGVNGKEIDGRNIKVNKARPKEENRNRDRDRNQGYRQRR